MTTLHLAHPHRTAEATFDEARHARIDVEHGPPYALTVADKLDVRLCSLVGARNAFDVLHQHLDVLAVAQLQDDLAAAPIVSDVRGAWLVQLCLRPCASSGT